MSWKRILKARTEEEEDREVKFILKDVGDFEWSTDFRDPQHLFEVCYKLYKEKGLEGLIEYLEFVEYRLERKVDPYDVVGVDVLDLRYTIEDLERLRVITKEKKPMDRVSTTASKLPQDEEAAKRTEENEAELLARLRARNKKAKGENNE